MCIVDTGVDWQHPDLAANLWMNEKEMNGPGATAANGYQNGIDDDNDGEDPHCNAPWCTSCRGTGTPMQSEAASCRVNGSLC